MAKNIRLALVGHGISGKGGRGAGLFKLAVESLDGVVPAAICDNDPEALAEARQAFPNAPVFDNFDAMLDKAEMDALIIATPVNYHAEPAVKALARNIHVLSEIECVYTVEEAQVLWDAHLKSRAIYMTGENSNFKGFIDAAVDLKRRGLFGDPIYVEAEYIHDCRYLWEKTPWRKPSNRPGNMPIQYCTHSLGPVLRLIDEDLEWVSCFDTGSHINKEEGQHDANAALFRTKSNVVVRVLTSFINNAVGGQQSYRFFTTKGTFERTQPQMTTMGVTPLASQRTLFYSTDLPLCKNQIELPVAMAPVANLNNPKATGHGGVDYAMLDAFIKAIREGLPSPISLKDGLRMTLPGTFAAESARRGGELIKIRYPWSSK